MEYSPYLGQMTFEPGNCGIPPLDMSSCNLYNNNTNNNSTANNDSNNNTDIALRCPPGSQSVVAAAYGAYNSMRQFHESQSMLSATLQQQQLQQQNNVPSCGIHARSRDHSMFSSGRLL